MLQEKYSQQRLCTLQSHLTKVEETKKIVADLIKKYNVNLISCGNGTASRESEQIISDMIKGI